MPGTNPLLTLKITELISFKQITPGALGNNPVLALNNCGITAVGGISNNPTTFSIGQMTVFSNTFYGLVGQTTKGNRVSYVDIVILKDPGQLNNKAIQAGVRLTQSAVPVNWRGLEMMNVINRSRLSQAPVASTLTEDNSAYYEFVVSKKTAYAYVNKQLVWTSTYPVSTTVNTPLVIRIGMDNISYTVPSDDGFTFMFDDIYTAELDYNSDGTVTPQLLGNLTLEPFTVASYTGDKHSNTKNQDIVTALNTLDPNNDMGALAIKPVEQPASVTFNVPDIAGKSIYGASLNIVYKDSIAPNNRLSYQITEGTTQIPEETITERNADTTGYTTFNTILTTPEGGGDWNADNLKFKLDLVNKGEE
ncbi:hypothetical protein D7O18_22060 [Salmonella enterica subsp. enterica serovar Muenchen]|nr:hypothetical protein [Salmonella enterica subsp. enterica serovar Muenchen]